MVAENVKYGRVVCRCTGRILSSVFLRPRALLKTRVTGRLMPVDTRVSRRGSKSSSDDGDGRLVTPRPRRRTASTEMTAIRYYRLMRHLRCCLGLVDSRYRRIEFEAQSRVAQDFREFHLDPYRKSYFRALTTVTVSDGSRRTLHLVVSNLRCLPPCPMKAGLSARLVLNDPFDVQYPRELLFPADLPDQRKKLEAKARRNGIYLLLCSPRGFRFHHSRAWTVNVQTVLNFSLSVSK